MKLVLRTDVPQVGVKGDIVDVADGYGRNYLVPKGLAFPATASVEAQASAMRRNRDARDASDRAAASEDRGANDRAAGDAGTHRQRRALAQHASTTSSGSHARTDSAAADPNGLGASERAGGRAA